MVVNTMPDISLYFVRTSSGKEGKKSMGSGAGQQVKPIV